MDDPHGIQIQSGAIVHTTVLVMSHMMEIDWSHDGSMMRIDCVSVGPDSGDIPLG